MTWGFLRLCPQDFVTLSIRLKSENRFAAQIFWCGEADGKFDRHNAMSRMVEGGAEREYSFRIPHQRVRRLRFDFGGKPGSVEVLDMRLLGAKNEILDFGKFTFSQDVESHSVTGDGKLLVTSKKLDPFMVYDQPLDVAAGFMPEWTMVAWLGVIGMFAMFLSGAVERACRRWFCKSGLNQTAMPVFRPRTMSAETSSKIRNLGFVCAIIVVFAHSSPGYRSTPVGSLAWWLYSLADVKEIAVPFFFMVSGYLLAGHVGELGWYRAAASKRLKTLLLPFVLWCLLWIAYLFCSVVVSNAFGSLPLSTGLRPWMGGSEYLGLNPVQHPLLGPLWYVRALLFFVAASPVLLLLLEKWKWFFLASAFLVGAFRPGYVQCVGNLSYTFVYFLGFGRLFYFLVGMSLRLGWLKIPSGAVMKALGCCSIGLVIACNALAMTTLLEKDVLIRFFLEISIFPLMFVAWLAVSRRQWSRWLTSMSFPVYVLHWFVLDLHARFFFRYGETFGQVLFQFGFTVLVTMGIVAVIKRFFPQKVHETLFGGR